VFISNVDIDGYLLGHGAPDDMHRYLVCDIFKPQANVAPLAETATLPRAAASMLSGIEAVGGDPSNVTLTTLQRAAGRGMRDFLSTFAAGCSASQWP
jgi:hypothetical protein